MRGEIAFEPALRERVALLKGLATEVVAKVLAERIEIMPGAALLVATMRAAGAHTALVSGGFTAFVEPIARAIGFHETRANALLFEAERVHRPRRRADPRGARRRRRRCSSSAARLRLDPAETLAVGDGANDIGMIRRAGLGVGFRAKPALREGGRRDDRPRGPARPALPAGLSARGVCPRLNRGPSA